MAAAARPIFGFVSLILVAGGLLLQFLVILSGAVNGSPENQIYFLQASGLGRIAGARNPSRWTFFAVCGADSTGHNSNCGAVVPALPFDPPRNFGTKTNVPAPFIGTHKFYYLSRFMFAFYLIALLFGVFALFTGLLALCSRLGGYLSGLNASIALFFQTLAAALMTAWTVEGRNAFNKNGYSATLGKKAYGFTWGAMACYLIATVLFCMGGAVGRDRSGTVSRKRSTRSTRSRGSFLETESQRRVKDDYA